MWISKRVLVAVLAAAIGAVSLAIAVGAAGKSRGHGNPLVKESLAPSLPTDPTFHGVAPGGVPWELKRGQVRIKRNDKLNLRVKGLVIPAMGTPGGANTVSASLYCGADSETAAADTTQQVPISRKGNARIHDTSFDVPDTCLAPVVLLHPNGNAANYIAVDGWRLR
jgi:hypothetical protein